MSHYETTDDRAAFDALVAEVDGVGKAAREIEVGDRLHIGFFRAGWPVWAVVHKLEMKPKTVWLWCVGQPPAYGRVNLRPRHDDQFIAAKEES